MHAYTRKIFVNFPCSLEKLYTTISSRTPRNLVCSQKPRVSAVGTQMLRAFLQIFHTLLACLTLINPGSPPVNEAAGDCNPELHCTAGHIFADKSCDGESQSDDPDDEVHKACETPLHHLRLPAKIPACSPPLTLYPLPARLSARHFSRAPPPAHLS